MKGNKFLIELITSMLVILILASFIGYKEDERRKNVPVIPTEETTEDDEDDLSNIVIKEENDIDVINSKTVTINEKEHTFKIRIASNLLENKNEYETIVLLTYDDKPIDKALINYEIPSEEAKDNVISDIEKSGDDIDIRIMLGLDEKEYFVYRLNNSSNENSIDVYKIFNDEGTLLAKISADFYSHLNLTFGNNTNAYLNEEDKTTYNYFAFEREKIRYLTLSDKKNCNNILESDFKEMFITIRNNNVILSESTRYHGKEFEGNDICEDKFTVNIIKKDNEKNKVELKEGKAKIKSTNITVGEHNFGIDLYRNIYKENGKLYVDIYYDLSNYNFIILKNLILYKGLETYDENMDISELDFIKVIKSFDGESYLLIEDYDSTDDYFGLTIYGLDTKVKAGKISFNCFNSYPDSISEYIVNNKRYYIEDGKIIYIKSNSNFYYKVTVNPIDDKLVYDYEKLSEIDNEMYEKVFATKEE